MWIEVVNWVLFGLLIVGIGLNSWTLRMNRSTLSQVRKNLADTDDNLKRVHQLQEDYVSAKKALVDRWHEAVEGLRTTSHLLLEYKDKYLDFEIPENTGGPAEYRDFKNIQGHVEGSLIAATGHDQTVN